MSAAIAAFVGALSAYQYIVSMPWEVGLYKIPLQTYFLANELAVAQGTPGMTTQYNERLTAVLLLVLLRFVLGFGFTWLPLKLVGTLVAVIRRIRIVE